VTGYARPLQLTGLAAPSAKTRKVSEDDFWESKAELSPKPPIQNLPNTAQKATFHGAAKIALSKLPAFDAFSLNTPSEIGNIDAIFNRVRPGIQMNRMQRLVKDCILCSNENTVVCAPTGKPCLYIMLHAILKAAFRLWNSSSHGNGHLQTVSAIVASTKSNSQNSLHCSNETARNRTKAGMGKVSH